MISDPVGNFLTMLRNSYMAGNVEFYAPNSRIVAAVAVILKNEGFIEDFSVMEVAKSKVTSISTLHVKLRYTDLGGALREVKRVSKPGRRVYVSVKDLKSCYNGFGVYILSTVKGVMADHMARSCNVGGELLCRVF